MAHLFEPCLQRGRILRHDALCGGGEAVSESIMGASDGMCCSLIISYTSR